MKIGLVIILYNPTTEDLQQIEKLQAEYIVATVDNTHINRGIACAQNEGIKVLQQKGVDFVLLLDQDSRIDIDFPRKMVAEYERIEQEHPNLFALGPSLHYHTTEDSKAFVPQREIIASGSCIRMSNLEKVGLLEEELFIDFVDFEWCWRANAKGYICGRTNQIRMEHHVGQHLIRIGRYYIFISQPERYFYQFRNHKILCGRDYVPTQWKIATGIKHIARFIYLPWFYGGRELLKNMWRGWTSN